jgi:hypothetical protein
LDRLSTYTSAFLLWALAAAPAAAGITGVCPDGSIYIVPRAALIPCKDSKQVAPDEVPPIKPEMLPRPYGWEVFNRRNDPNNPYNLVDTGRAVRGDAPATPPEVSARPPVVASTGISNLGLSPEELRDLALIVEYAQRHAPAAIARRGSAGSPGLVVRLAQSRSFEARLREASLRAGRAVRGPVVLFTAVGGDEAGFHANLTFVQGHVAFHPDAGRDGELGLLEGRLGKLAPDETVLGYVVLPEHMDLSQPMDIYWNDHQVTATLRP